jgi:hypothetical protein
VHDQGAFCSISIAIPQWLHLMQDSYKDDVFAKELMTKLSLDATSMPHYTFKDGLLRYKGRVWIGKDPAIHHQLISAPHNSALGGHSGVPVTYRRLKQLFAWKGMKTEVH